MVVSNHKRILLLIAGNMNESVIISRNATNEKAGRWERLQELICFGLWKAELLNVFLPVHLWWNATKLFQKLRT